MKSWRVVRSQIVLTLTVVATAASSRTAAGSENVAERIQQARAKISQNELLRREALDHLYVLNRGIKDTERRENRLNEILVEAETRVRTLARNVAVLESQSESQRLGINRRLRQLYQERNQDTMRWIFSASSIVGLERHRRFLRRLIDSNYQQLKQYVGSLEDFNQKRTELKKIVAHFSRIKQMILSQQAELSRQLAEKSQFIAQLKHSQNLSFSQLKELRAQSGPASDPLSYAFFERKGSLPMPIEAGIARPYGTYVDPQFKFRLAQKGLFFFARRQAEVKAIYRGRVAFANFVPGYGNTVIVDHGDNYYSVYAFISRVRVAEGVEVREGEPLGYSGEGGDSPLFGPGLYFEIRHFTDAIDPGGWIKDSVTEPKLTAKANEA